ncbi:MAG: AAA family ATPase [Oscillospiraceae bacterium]|nr:AAA family ATPase [Oscillospiraceae bacterium]
MKKVISVANQKGGVGKTTTTLNLAAGLVQKGKKTLAIDFDPQKNLSDYLGFEPDDGITIADLMLSAAQGTQLDPQPAIRTNKEGIDFIPSNIKLSSADMFLAQAMFREQTLKHILSSPAFEIYDYILIDCLPSLGILLTNALIASDSLIIPVQAQKFALDGIDALLSAYDFVKNYANHDLTIDGILLTMADGTNMSKAVEEALQERFPNELFRTRISRSVEATNSSYVQASLISSRNSKLGVQYKSLVEELLRKEVVI